MLIVKDAKRMGKKALKAKRKKSKDDWDKIWVRINFCAKNGHSNISIHNSEMPQGMIKHLQKKGFKVTEIGVEYLIQW